MPRHNNNVKKLRIPAIEIKYRVGNYVERVQIDLLSLFAYAVTGFVIPVIVHNVFYVALYGLVYTSLTTTFLVIAHKFKKLVAEALAMLIFGMFHIPSLFAGLLYITLL